MFVDDVNNARRHGERNNSKDDGEGLAGPTDGLIQRPLLIREARIIGPHVRDGIVVRLFTGARRRRLQHRSSCAGSSSAIRASKCGGICSMVNTA